MLTCTQIICLEFDWWLVWIEKLSYKHLYQSDRAWSEWIVEWLKRGGVDLKQSNQDGKCLNMTFFSIAFKNILHTRAVPWSICLSEPFYNNIYNDSFTSYELAYIRLKDWSVKETTFTKYIYQICAKKTLITFVCFPFF